MPFGHFPLGLATPRPPRPRLLCLLWLESALYRAHRARRALSDWLHQTLWVLLNGWLVMAAPGFHGLLSWAQGHDSWAEFCDDSSISTPATGFKNYLQHEPRFLEYLKRRDSCDDSRLVCYQRFFRHLAEKGFGWCTG